MGKTAAASSFSSSSNCLFSSSLFNYAASSTDYIALIDWVVVNDELDMMCHEAVMASKIFSWYR
jgi:hypothetical protein